MRYTPELQSASIVLVGKLNPPIFSPAWFAKIGVLTDQELEVTSTQIIHPEIAQFMLERFRLEVMPNRFMITTPVEPSDSR